MMFRALAPLLPIAVFSAAAFADAVPAGTPVITAVGDGIWRVRFLPADGAVPVKVTGTLPTRSAAVAGTAGSVVWENGRVIVRDAAGRTLLTQSPPVFSRTSRDTAVKAVWESADGAGLYGLGSYQDERLNLRGRTVRGAQTNTDDTVPLLVSTGGYGILWDNSSPFFFTSEAGNNRFAFESPYAGESDCYLLLGTPDEIVARYRRLTGRAPMYPKWAFGYHQSKERYQTQKEVLDIAARFRATGFPLDLLIQDWQYWGGHGWNACVFDKAVFPDPQGLVNTLHAQGIRYITSVWPSFTDGNKGSTIFKTLSKNKLLSTGHSDFNHMQFYDVFDPRARDLVWNAAKTGILDMGTDGWWLDATEPEFGTPKNDRDLPALRFGATSLGPMSAVANAYPLEAVGTFYNGMRRETSAKRPFILTRSAYTGVQRYGATYWTGDVASTWSSLRAQIPAVLGMSFSGIPYVNTDMGGFSQSFPGGSANKDFRELVVRWTQFGTFCTEMRMHGTGAPREPWCFGNPGEPTYDTLLAFAKLRYRLLPYIYSVSADVTRRDASMMRALPMAFPSEKALENIADQFLFGPAFLVSPVTESRSKDRVIPGPALRDREGIAGGLTGSYFKDTTFGTKVLERRDGEMNFNWSKTPRGGVGPDPSMDPIPGVPGMNDFAVRWQGTVVAEGAGEYVIVAKASDGDVRLKVGDRPEVSASGASGAATVKLTLPAGAVVPVTLSYTHRKGRPHVELRWVTPGEQADATARRVVLPAAADWYDFFTNERLKGGATLDLRVPLERMPIHIRAGSIVPFGPEIRHTGERSEKPLEIRVYPGADAAFDLYDDSGDGAGWETGEGAVVPLRWHDKTGELVMEVRRGTFPGMAPSFPVVVRILGENGVWRDTPATYTGDRLVVRR